MRKVQFGEDRFTHSSSSFKLFLTQFCMNNRHTHVHRKKKEKNCQKKKLEHAFSACRTWDIYAKTNSKCHFRESNETI